MPRIADSIRLRLLALAAVWLTVALLGAWVVIGGVLVDLSGQHEHQGLVDPRRHLAILDAVVEDGATAPTANAAEMAARLTA